MEETTKKRGRKFLRVIVILLSVITVFLLYNLFVSPSVDEAHKAKYPTIEKVPEAENGWTDYQLAIKDIGEYEEISQEAPFPLERLAQEDEEIKAEHKAYLELHKPALDYIQSGAKKPKSQFNSQPPIFNSPVPSLLQTKSLINLSGMQSRLLIAEGKYKEAAQLSLDTYRFGTRINEPYSLLISSLISVVGRRQASYPLFQLINDDKTDADTDLNIAKQIAEMDSSLPTPTQAIEWEYDAGLRSIEGFLIKGTSKIDLDVDWNKLPQGIKQRIFNGFIDEAHENFSALQPSLEKWDFEKLREIEKTVINEKINNWYWHASIGRIIGAILANTAIPNFSNTAKSFYFDRANSAALQVFAACSAYKKTHGKFPEKLEDAVSAANIKVPNDPVTGQPVKYRLEQDKPLIWFVGVDGKDDGGKESYQLTNRVIPAPGKDLIYKFGEYPYLKEKPIISETPANNSVSPKK